jgi:hypothetical protein
MAGRIYSFEKFNYSLRPSKQVERKILIEKLIRLSQISYPLRDYTYLGFGSVYYVDFQMFHKFLHIRNMVCVEGSPNERRMRFNMPYKCITLHMKAFSEFVAEVDPNRKYLVWLDYDYPVNEEMLRDIDNCVHRLSKGSIFLVTAEARARPPKDASKEVEDLSGDDLDDFLINHFNEILGDLVGRKVTRNDLDQMGISQLFVKALTKRVIETTLLRNEDLTYIQLFNYWYKDGAPMLTLGGVIGDEDENRRLTQELANEEFIVRGDEPLIISVPHLTAREKHWLDSRICPELTVRELEFELEEESLDRFRMFYKQYPSYFESLF